MNFKSGFGVISAAVLPLFVGAADYTLVKSPQSLADWRSGAFYEGEVAPPEDCSATIIIPEGLECLVDDDAMAFANGIYWFKTMGDGAVVTFNITTNSDLLASVDSDATWRNYGMLVKTGAGMLRLLATGRDTNYGDYWVDMDVREGALYLENGGYVGGVNVEEQAVVLLNGGPDKSHSRVFGVVGPRGLTGSGVVSNVSPVAAGCALQPNWGSDEPRVFSGRLANLTVLNGGNLHLTNMDNDIASIGVYNGNGNTNAGVLGVSKIGMEGQPSSIGAGDTFGFNATGSGTLLYLGQGETTDKLMEINRAPYPNIINAGEHGGVNFTGYFRLYTPDTLVRLWLDGENDEPCTISGRVGVYYADDAMAKAYVTKKGSGTWNFAHWDGAKAPRNGLGGFWVQNGVLGFETFGETNEVSAIGTPCEYFIGDEIPAVTDKYAPALSTAKRIPYCFRVGTTNDLSQTGLLEYYGTKRVISRTRPVAVDGCGGFLSGTNGAHFVEESGVSALTDGATLVLDGVVDGEDVVKNLSDGEGKLSVEKRGSGTWTIAGTNNTFTGGIAVKGGTLVLRGISGKLTWFRFTAENRNQETYFDMSEFGVFGVDGTCLSRGLKTTPDSLASDSRTSLMEQSLYAKIAPGECSLGHLFRNGLNIDISQLFDCISDSTKSRVQLMDYGKGDSSFVFRLPRTIDAAATYDIAFLYSNQAFRPWRMEGSVDGETWYVIDTMTDAADLPAVSGYAKWRFNTNKTIDDTIGATPPVKLTNGRPLVGFTNETVIVYSNPVSVANGATIEAEGLVKLTSLKVDGSLPAGTVKGFELADDLTLDVVNMPRDRRIELPVNFSDVTGLEGTENWTLKENGKVTGKFTASLKDGKIILDRAGLLFLVR